jgi:hypothetical protein
MSTLNDINPRAPFVDSNGYLTEYWLRWLMALHIRTGGTVAPSNNDLSVDLPEDAGLEELRAQLFTFMDAVGQAPPSQPELPQEDFTPPYQETPREEILETQVRSLAEQVAVLQKEIDGLKQGLSA